MAVSFFEVGRSTQASSDTIVIPVGIDVPRSDPTGGATIMFVFVQVPFDYSGSISGVTDDGATDPFYGTCIFEDGLNNYSAPAGLVFGLILNPLTAANSITVTMNSAADFLAAGAWAITGVRCVPVNAQSIPPTWLFGVSDPGAFQAATDLDGSNASVDAGWLRNPDLSIHMVTPSGAVTDMNWEWRAGDLAFYLTSNNSASSDEMGWTWADGSITDFAQWDIDTGMGGSHDWWSMALGTQAPPPSDPTAAPSVDGAWGSGESTFFTGGFALSVIAGPGPSCTTPPAFGGPVFNHIHRAAFATEAPS